MLFVPGSVIHNRFDWYLDCNLPPPPPFYLGEVIRNETYPFVDAPAKMFPNNPIFNLTFPLLFPGIFNSLQNSSINRGWLLTDLKICGCVVN